MKKSASQSHLNQNIKTQANTTSASIIPANTASSSQVSQLENKVVELRNNENFNRSFISAEGSLQTAEGSLQTAEGSTTYEEPITNQDVNIQEQELSIKEAVSRSMTLYFEHLGDHDASKLYEMVMGEVEPALLNAVLKHTRGNQSKASIALGINRGTLRKKLHMYGIE